MHEQCVPGPVLSFVGPGNEAKATVAMLHAYTVYYYDYVYLA